VTEPDDIWVRHGQLMGLLQDGESFADTLERVAKIACAAIPGCSAGSVTLWSEGHPYTIVSTDDFARDIDEAQYETLEGPCLDASRTNKSYEITDMENDGRWPTFSAVAAKRGARSSLSLPLAVRGESLGALNLYSTELAGFRGALETGRLFAVQAGVAIANAQVFNASRALADELQETLRNRAILDQATGILMTRHDCGPAEARALLAEAAQRDGLDERAAALRVIDGAASSLE
jgi:GAF domain-containing protein